MITLLPETPSILNTPDTPQARQRDGLNRCPRCQSIKPDFLGCDCLLWAFWDAGEFEAAINPEKWENWDWETDSPQTPHDLFDATKHAKDVTKALNETSMAVWAKNFAVAAEKIAAYMLNTWYPEGVDSCYVYIKAPTEETPVKYKAVRRVRVELDLEGTPQNQCCMPRFPRNWEFSGVDCSSNGNHVLGGCIVCSNSFDEPESPATGTSPLNPNLDNVPDVFREWPHSDSDLMDL